MSSEIQNDAPVVAEIAPEQVTTAPLVSDEVTPEQTPKEAKTFTQEELDAAIGKRLAREQRKWEREQSRRQVQATPSNVPISQADFSSNEEYVEALATRKAAELIAHREQAREQDAVLEAYHDKEEEARGKYDDFEQVAYNPKLPITDVMAQAIQGSDIGPDIAYHLGSNPKEAARIAKLPPVLQAKEIGKIEVSLANNPPTKKTTSAPAPIAPVSARTSSAPAVDTTDPRSIKTMSTSEWIEADRQRQKKALEAKYRR